VTDDAVATYPCPACGLTADLARGCAGCGRPPDPDAAEVIRLDGVIAQLAAREQRWREAHAEVVAELAQAQARRHALAARVTAAAQAPPPRAAPPTPAAPAGPVRQPAPETSTRAVQTLLFVLGGLLLGTGAIVFTAVAWARFGVTGRAAILAVVTGLVLAAPVVARRRGLGGTAETFAALGLLLVVLDGYAIWSVDLFGARSVAPATWSAAVCAGTALVAVGYARGTGLTGPAFAALGLLQPVLPLLAVEAHPTIAGWAYVWVALAAADLGLTRWLRGAGRLRGTGAVRVALRVCGWVFTGAALVAGASLALVAVLTAGTPVAGLVAGGALLATAAVLAGVAGVTGAGGWRAVAVVASMVALAVASGRVAALVWPGPLPVAAVAAAVGAAGAALGRRWARLRPGARVGAPLVIGPVGLVLGVAALVHATASVLAAWLRNAPVGPYDWQLPVALALLAAALVVAVPGAWREITAVGLALIALAIPPAVVAAWWSPVLVDLVVAAALILAAVQVTRTRAAAVVAAVAAVLAGHALLVAAAATTTMAVALGAVALLGLGAAARAHRPASPPRARLVIGRIALLAGMLAVPGAVAATVAAAGAAPVWPPRAALASTALLVLVVAAARRWTPVYLSTAAAAVHVATPVAVIGGFAEAAGVVGVYAGGALLVLVTTAVLRPPARRGWWLAVRAPAAGVVLLAAAPQLVVLLFGPYQWLARIWSGRPAGSGVAVTGQWPGTWATPVALAALAAAAALAAWLLAGRWRAALGVGSLVAPAPVLAGMVQAGVPWPGVAAASLLLGSALALVAALRAVGMRAAAGAGFGVLLVGAGLAGLLPQRWSTLVGLALTVLVAGAAGRAGRTVAARLAGWVGAVGAALVLALASALAADLPLRVAALAVLAAAAVALAGGGLLRDRRPEAIAVESAAHTGALAALVLAATSSSASAAAVAALWGVALGLRALWPGEAAGSAPARVTKATGRLTRAAAAVGCELLAWWLLLASREVATVEAYTVPAAVFAAAVGAVVLRSRPEVGSWVALGPALAAGFLPSLAAVLIQPDVPLRRLLLGAAAVAVVMTGAFRRWRAPVLAGGAVAVLVAVRELTLVWQLLDTWIPLTAAGLLLVALAATYERRRRDLSRLRGALARMT
jgi:hypothetical protein